MKFENKFLDLVDFICSESTLNQHEQVSFLTGIANKLSKIKTQTLKWRNFLVWEIHNDVAKSDHYPTEKLLGEGRINLCNLCEYHKLNACTDTLKNIRIKQIIKFKAKQKISKLKNVQKLNSYLLDKNLITKIKMSKQIESSGEVEVKKSKCGRKPYDSAKKLEVETIKKLADSEAILINERRRMAGKDLLSKEEKKEIKKNIAKNYRNKRPVEEDCDIDELTQTQPKKSANSKLHSSKSTTLSAPVGGHNLEQAIGNIASKKDELSFPKTSETKLNKSLNVITRFSIGKATQNSTSSDDDEDNESTTSMRTLITGPSDVVFNKEYSIAELLERNKIRAEIINKGKLDPIEDKTQIELLITQELQKNAFANLLSGKKKKFIMDSSTHEQEINLMAPLDEITTTVTKNNENISLTNQLTSRRAHSIGVTISQTEGGAPACSIDNGGDIEKSTGNNNNLTNLDRSSRRAQSIGVTISQTEGGAPACSVENGGKCLNSMDINKSKKISDFFLSFKNSNNFKNNTKNDFILNDMGSKAPSNDNQNGTGLELSKNDDTPCSQQIINILDSLNKQPANESLTGNKNNPSNDSIDAQSKRVSNGIDKALATIDLMENCLRNGNLGQNESYNNIIEEDRINATINKENKLINDSLNSSAYSTKNKQQKIAEKTNKSILSINANNTNDDAEIDFIESFDLSSSTLSFPSPFKRLNKNTNQMKPTASSSLIDVDSLSTTQKLLQIQAEPNCIQKNGYYSLSLSTMKSISDKHGLEKEVEKVKALLKSKEKNAETTRNAQENNMIKGSHTKTAERKKAHEIKPLSMYKTTYAEYMKRLEIHLKEKKLLEFQKTNDELEKKYPSNEYSLIIYSAGINDKCRISEPFLEEIQRCTRVTSEHIESIEIVKNINNPEIPGIQVNLNSFTDYKTLRNMRNWPKNSFNHGINFIQILPPKLFVTILNVDQSININKDELIQLEHEYGLVDVKRITDGEGRESNKLKAGVKTKWHYLNVIRNGIRLHWRRRRVIPDLRKVRPCNDCGSLRHNSKRIKCHLGPRCIICSESHLHTLHEPTNDKRQCINCGGSHATNDRICTLIRKKAKDMNRFVLNMLVNEGVYKNDDEPFENERDNNGELIKNLRCDDNQILNNKQLLTVLNGMVKSHLEPFELEQQNQRKQLSELSNRVLSCETTVNEVREGIKTTNENLKNLSQTVSTLPTHESLKSMFSEVLTQHLGK